MFGWSLKLFRVRGIQLSLHWSFLLLLAWAANDGYVSGGISGMVVSVVLMLALFTCVVLHELGHSFTAMHFGIGVRRILLMPIGGQAEFDSIPREPVRELLITVAGPAVNFAIAFVLWLVIPGTTAFVVDFVGHLLTFDLAGARIPDTDSLVANLGLVLLASNITLGLFNLVPVFPMDGGRIFRALLAIRLPYVRATYWAALVGKVLGLAGILLSVISGSYLRAVLFTYILMAGEAEYRAVKRREETDAHWREMLARLHAIRARQAEEPPLWPKDPPLL